MGAYLVAGLGNPGSAYETTRHNMGFLTADLIVRRMKGRFVRTRWNAAAAKCSFAGEEVVIIKPHSFMNLSGGPVAAAMRATGVDPSRLIVIFDDMDIDPGRIRVRFSGSAGGHKGMKSIIGAIGSDEFARVRIGIGRPPAYSETADFVLQRPDRQEARLLAFAIESAAAAVEEIIISGVAAAASKFNGQIPPADL